MKKKVAGILIALVACLGFAAYFFLKINPSALSYMETNLTEQIKRQLQEDSEDSLLISIQRPGTWHDLFTPEDWTFVVQYADASNPHFYQLDIDKRNLSRLLPPKRTWRNAKSPIQTHKTPPPALLIRRKGCLP